MTPLSSEQILLRQVLQRPQHLSNMPAAGQESVLRILRQAGLLPWLAYRLKQAQGIHLLAANIQDHLEGAVVVAREHARRVLWELEEVGQILRPAGISVTVLKGTAYLLRGIPAMDHRMIADVDLLLGESEVVAAEKLLQANGWHSQVSHPYDRHYYQAWMHQIPPLVHKHRSTEVDIHHRLLPKTNRRSFAAAPLLARRHLLDPWQEMTTLADEDMVLHAVMQLFQDGDLINPLRDLVDLDILLGHFSKQEGFWEKLGQRADHFNMLRPLFYALRYTRFVLQTPTPPAMLDRLAPARPRLPILRLMDRLVIRAALPPPPWPRTMGMGLTHTLLLARGHWLRMPPLILIPHLLQKSWRRLRPEQA